MLYFRGRFQAPTATCAINDELLEVKAGVYGSNLT